MAALRWSSVMKGYRNFLGLCNVRSQLWASSDACKDQEEKPSCKKKEEVPCEKLARAEDCSLIPHKPKEECPKEVKDCQENAVATTKPCEEGAEGGEDEIEECQVMLSEPLKPTDHSDDECYDPKIVIIGAGLSGLSCANRLATMGVSNITLLEATNRAGGRIQSALFGDTVVNLGGVWDDGEACEANNDLMDNPVLYHADKFGMVHSCKYLSMAKSIMTECDGTPLPLPPSFIALTKMKRILAVANSLRTTSPYIDLGRTDSYIGMRMQQELRGIPDELKGPAARVFTALTMLATDKNYIGSDDLGPFITIPGSHVKIPLGCTGVLTPLLKNVAKHIKYNKKVCNISWGSLSGLNGRRAIVRTSDGGEYSADFVIFTASLGVLKQSHDGLFCPTLPCPYVKAIESIQYEHVNKIFLYYKVPIRCWRQDRICWQMDAEDVASLKGPMGGLREIKELFNSERVISVTLEGKGALKSETASEETLVEELTSYIRKKSGDCAPYPDDILRTKWSSNKFYQGARAVKALKANPLPFSGTPNPPVIFFAGDGTAEKNAGNVRGAFIAGLREADRILSYLPGSRNESQATDACLQLQASLSS